MNDEVIGDLKEIFLMFDTDVDGVLTIDQVYQAIGVLGIRRSGLREKYHFPKRLFSYNFNETLRSFQMRKYWLRSRKSLRITKTIL